MALKARSILVSLLTVVSCALIATPAAAQVWSNGYSYRSTVTIDHTKVPNTDQSNFPVLISGTYSYLATTANGGDVTNPNGYDIIFASDAAGSNLLPFERESYNAATGAVLYWVQVPTVSHTTDTNFYVFFGNASIYTDQSNKTGVWDSNFKGVWHLPNGSTLSGADSTSNGFNLTNNNNTGATSGKIDGAAIFNGSSNYLTNSSLAITAGSSITVSFWNYVPSADVRNAVLFSIGGSDNPNRIMASAPWSDDNIYWDYGNLNAGGRVDTSYSSDLGAWTHVALEYNASTSQHLLYLNGSLAASSTNSNAPTSNQTGIWIGVWTLSNGYFHEGTVDEFRVSTTARSADWIASEYANQGSPSTFYSIGSPQSGTATAPNISSLSPTAAPVGYAVTITGTNFGSSPGTVMFNDTTATATNWTNTSISTSVPTGATSGNVVVEAGGLPSNGLSFTVLPVPSITGISPASGANGIRVTITGTNFGATQGSSTVTFNGTSATPTSWSTASIVVPVPSGATTGNVVVTASGVPSNATPFTVTSAPGIYNLSPSSGMVGTLVTVVGTNFTDSQGSSTVTFNGAAQTVISWSDTAIQFAIPSGAASGPVVVTVNGQTSNSATFTVTVLPTGWSDTDIGSLNPTGNASYSAGVLTLTSGVNVAGIGGTADNLHFAYVPLSGDGTIIARLASASVSNNSTIETGVMIRNSLAQDAADAFVELNSGSYYYMARSSDGASSQNDGDVSATVPHWLEVVRSGNNFSTYVSSNGLFWSQIAYTQTLTMGSTVYVGLYVSGYQGTGTATATFDNVSVNSATNPAPAISYIAPTTGPAGTQVQIFGSGFGASQNGSVVTLNGEAVTINAWSASSITFTVPSNATSGEVSVSVAPSMNVGNPEIFQVTTQALPTAWLDQDIGPASLAGTATYANGVFTISGAGRVDQTADSMHFAYQPLSGDGTIIARITGTSSSNVQAGVMIRETLDAGSDSAFEFYMTQNYYGYINYYYRPTSGGTVYNQSDTGTLNLPYWVKLVRSGNTFSAYVSWNGVYWVQNGSVTISMGTNAYIGLFVANVNASSATTVTFDNVSVSSSTSSVPNITAVSPTTASVGEQIVISGSGFGSSQSNSVVLLNGAVIPVDAWSDTTLAVTIPSGASSGPLVVSVAPDMNNSNPVVFEVTANPLPIPWANADVGAVSVAGSATYSSGAITLNTAPGPRIGGNTDAMQFAFQQLTGDGSITARVVSTSGGTPDISAGVMLRNTLDPGSMDAYTFYYYDDSYPYYYFYFRPTADGTVYNQGQSGSYSPPYWVKMVRSGNSFSSYVSPDGSTWTQLSISETISMNQTVYAGLFVNGFQGSGAVSATFDNVALVIGTTPVITGMTPVLTGIGSTVTVSGSNFGATQGTSTLSFNGVNATSITSWSNSQIVALVPAGATTGPVAVTVNFIESLANPTLDVLNPVITAVSPPASPIGGTVTITGTGLGSAQPELNFNGTYEQAFAWSDTSATVRVPQSATTGPLTLISQGITSNSASFTVLSSLSITSASPTVGPVGSTVTITGTGFGSAQSTSTVNFNETAATVSSWSDTSITVVVPAVVDAGPINVTVAGITAYGPDFALSSGVQVTDSLGNVTNYTAVVAGGQWGISNSDGSGCSTCDIRGTKSYTFDDSGNTLTATDELGYVTSYAYDANNNVTSVEQPSVSGGTPTTTYTYNNFGEVLTETDPLGNVTTNTYDGNGNLTSVTTPKPNSSTAASVTQFTYNSLGELTQITDPLGHVTAMTYTPTGLIATITDPKQNVTTYGYDSRGNRTSITDALNHATTFTYDAMNRLTQITYPDNSTTGFGYDSRGRRTSVTDQNGKTTTYAYDDADRLVTVTDPANNVTTYGYDTEDNLTSITDANSHTTNFTYDAYGRVTKTAFPSNAFETYSYDADNDLTSKTDRKGQTIQYVYDALDRLTEKDYPDTTKVEYTYDLIGKILQVNDPTGTYGFSYDNMGRLTGTTANYSFLSATTFTNTYNYDAASNRTGYTAPDGSTNTYTYDTLNRLTTLANSATGSFGFSYDALSRRTQMTRPNGIDTNYSYDSLSRLLSVLHQSGSSTIDGDVYTLDPAGNRSTRQDDLAGVTTTYGYDNLYELLSATQGGTTTESYTYDPVGNRTASLGVPSYTTNSSNEMTANSNASYTYDSNGNTLTKTDSTGTTNYAWDYENRLTSVTLAGSSGTVTFKYDPFGRRIEKLSPSTTSIFAYDGNNLVETVSSSGSAVARYTQGQNFDEPLAMLRGNTTSYYDQDGLGSITSLSGASGELTQTYTYDSFGNITNSSGSLTNFFRYSGREFDAETDLYYYRARYYDPVSGRFLNEDPLETNGDDVNFYRYVGNSPNTFYDPSGEQRVNSPRTGPPNSTAWFPDPNNPGSVTVRVYGPGGEAVTDYDYGPADHQGHGDPHAHDWGYDKNGNPVRGPSRPIKPGEKVPPPTCPKSQAPPRPVGPPPYCTPQMPFDCMPNPHPGFGPIVPGFFPTPSPGPIPVPGIPGLGPISIPEWVPIFAF